MSKLGIVNFWNQPEPLELQREVKNPDAWRFEGQAMLIEVPILRGKDDTGETLFQAAQEKLGETLFELSKLADFKTQLERQYLGFSAPLGPKVSFSFPKITIYAHASSTNAELAQQFGLDRIALAMSYTQGSKDILTKSGISIRRKL